MKRADKQTVRGWMREPLLHFLILGVALFALYRVVSGPPATSDNDIVVTEGQIDSLVDVFSKTWQRLPTQSELQALIDDRVLEEVLYREALIMGLNENDTIIRRRLRQKMEFLIDDFAAAEPTDQELQAFLIEHPDRFQLDANISFEQIYFDELAGDEAARVLAALRDGSEPDIDNTVGPQLLPVHFDVASAREIQGVFGQKFSEAVFMVEREHWVGPIESPFGMHLVKVNERAEGRLLELSQIRDAVVRDWLSDRRRTAQETLFEQLRSQYTVTLELPETMSGESASTAVVNP